MGEGHKLRYGRVTKKFKSWDPTSSAEGFKTQGSSSVYRCVKRANLAPDDFGPDSDPSHHNGDDGTNNGSPDTSPPADSVPGSATPTPTSAPPTSPSGNLPADLAVRFGSNMITEDVYQVNHGGPDGYWWQGTWCWGRRRGLTFMFSPIVNCITCIIYIRRKSPEHATLKCTQMLRKT